MLYLQVTNNIRQSLNSFFKWKPVCSVLPLSQWHSRQAAAHPSPLPTPLNWISRKGNGWIDGWIAGTSTVCHLSFETMLLLHCMSAIWHLHCLLCIQEFRNWSIYTTNTVQHMSFKFCHSEKKNCHEAIWDKDIKIKIFTSHWNMQQGHASSLQAS